MMLLSILFIIMGMMTIASIAKPRITPINPRANT